MVEISKNQHMKRSLAKKKWVLFTSALGVLFMVVPFILVFFNPILFIANYRLRLGNGTMLHTLLSQEVEGARIYINLFNYTNVDRFLAGKDDVLKLEEVGPFVYQEYRTNDDLEINREPGVMRYTPNHRTELILEESVGRPEDLELFLPNIAFLSAIRMLSSYPRFLGQIFKMMIAGMNLKPIPKVKVQSFLWGVTDPFITVVNSVVPGLIYYNSSGLLTRFYDEGINYRLTLGTSESDKFQVKSVERYQLNNQTKTKDNIIVKSYTDSYEGAVFPPHLTPSTPINIYRYSICRSLNFIFKGTRAMDYGSDAFEYTFAESMFTGNKLCDKKGCPRGIMDLSKCYMGFPFAISKGHFLDADPRLFERIEGLKPNRSLHESSLFIDPKIGITVGAHMSAQYSLALGDMGLLPWIRRLSDMYLPVTHAVIKHPKLPEEAQSSLRLLYHYGPYILYSAQALCVLLGLGLLVYSRRLQWLRLKKRREGKTPEGKTPLSNNCSIMSKSPLLS